MVPAPPALARNPMQCPPRVSVESDQVINQIYKAALSNWEMGKMVILLFCVHFEGPEGSVRPRPSAAFFVVVAAAAAAVSSSSDNLGSLLPAACLSSPPS